MNPTLVLHSSPDWEQGVRWHFLLFAVFFFLLLFCGGCMCVPSAVTMLFRIASLRLRIPGPREGQLKKSSPSVDFAILCDERKEKNYARVSSAFLPFKCVALELFFQKGRSLTRFAHKCRRAPVEYFEIREKETGNEWAAEEYWMTAAKNCESRHFSG